MTADLLHGRPEPLGGGKLGEVQHPVDLPWPIMNAEAVFKQDSQFGAAQFLAPLEHGRKVREVWRHRGAKTIPPPVGEMLAVNGQYGVEVRTYLLCVLGIRRHARPVAVAVLGARNDQIRVRGDGGGIEVPVNVLRQPVDGKGGAEAAEHVVAGEPPAADIEEHRAQRLRAMQVVVYPEQALLVFRRPGDGEVVTAQELVENLLARVHLDASVSFDSTHDGSRSESAEASGHPRRSDRRRRAACSNQTHDSIIDDFRLYSRGMSTSSFTNPAP